MTIRRRPGWQGREALNGPERPPLPIHVPNDNEQRDLYCGRCGHLHSAHSTGTCLGDPMCFCKRTFDDE